MQIPHTKLSQAALRGLVEEYVTREGTDYGTQELSLEAKVASILRQLESGEVVVTFDPESSSCTLWPRRSLPPENA